MNKLRQTCCCSCCNRKSILKAFFERYLNGKSKHGDDSRGFFSKLFNKKNKNGKNSGKIDPNTLNDPVAIAAFLDQFGQALDKILLTNDIDQYEKVLREYHDTAIAYGLDSSKYEGILHPHWDRLKLWRKIESQADNLCSVEAYEQLFMLIGKEYPKLTSIILRKVRQNLDNYMKSKGIEIDKIEKAVNDHYSGKKLLDIDKLRSYKKQLLEISPELIPKRNSVLSLVEKLLAELLRRKLSEEAKRITITELMAILKKARIATTVKEVEAALEKYEECKLYLEMTTDIDRLVDQCRQRLLYLKELDSLKQVIHNINRQNIAEIREYSTPPPEVVQVIRSVVFLLGVPLNKLKTWDKVRVHFGMIGKNNIKHKIENFNPNDVSLAMSEEVDRMLKGLNLSIIDDVSQALGTFYAWSKCNAQYNFDEAVRSRR